MTAYLDFPFPERMQTWTVDFFEKILAAGCHGRADSCYPNVRGDDYRLLQGSLEVATRVIESFDLPVPPLC